MILRRRPQHRRPADVDIFNRIGQRTIRLGDRGLERIEIHHQQVDRWNTVFNHGPVVLTTPPQQAAVNFRMQGLEATVHHLGKASVVGDFYRGNAVAGQQLGSAASGENLHAPFDQSAGELHDAGLVGNADQGAAYG